MKVFLTFLLLAFTAMGIAHLISWITGESLNTALIYIALGSALMRDAKSFLKEKTNDH